MYQKKFPPRMLHEQENNLFALGSHLLRCLFFSLNRHISIRISQPSCVCDGCRDVIKRPPRKKKSWNDQQFMIHIINYDFFSSPAFAVKASLAFTDWLWWNLFGYWFCDRLLHIFPHRFQLRAIQTIETSRLNATVSRERSRTRRKSFFLNLFFTVDLN